MSHIHESPKSITVPLIVLACLSVAGGFINVPEALGGHHAFQSFLGNIVHVGEHSLSHSTEYMLMGVVIVLTIVLILLAYVTYVGKKSVPEDPSQLSGLSRILSNKYYIDELYDTIVVKPIYAISKFFYNIVELLGIDNLVNGLGKSVVYGSRGLRFLQDGSIGYYLFVMVIGIIVILSTTLW